MEVNVNNLVLKVITKIGPKILVSNVMKDVQNVTDLVKMNVFLVMTIITLNPTLATLI